MSDHIDIVKSLYSLFYKKNLSKRPPVLKDHVLLERGYVSLDRFHCIEWNTSAIIGYFPSSFSLQWNDSLNFEKIQYTIKLVFNVHLWDKGKMAADHLFKIRRSRLSVRSIMFRVFVLPEGNHVVKMVVVM